MEPPEWYVQAKAAIEAGRDESQAIIPHLHVKDQAWFDATLRAMFDAAPKDVFIDDIVDLGTRSTSHLVWFLHRMKLIRISLLCNVGPFAHDTTVRPRCFIALNQLSFSKTIELYGFNVECEHGHMLPPQVKHLFLRKCALPQSLISRGVRNNETLKTLVIQNPFRHTESERRRVAGFLNVVHSTNIERLGFFICTNVGVDAMKISLGDEKKAKKVKTLEMQFTNDVDVDAVLDAVMYVVEKCDHVFDHVRLDFYQNEMGELFSRSWSSIATIKTKYITLIAACSAKGTVLELWDKKSKLNVIDSDNVVVGFPDDDDDDNSLPSLQADEL